MKTVCVLCRRSISRTYKLASMYNMKSAKKIVDELNRTELYRNKWHYILTDEQGEEIYPTTLQQRARMLREIQER